MLLVRTAIAALLVLSACSADDPGPGDFGEPCSAAGECLEDLSCSADDVCLGDVLLRGTVLFPSQNQPSDEMRVAVFYDGDEGAGDPLIPSRAALELTFPTPVTYPVSFQLTGVPPGRWDVVAYVPQPADVTLRGQVTVDIADDGSFTVNGTPDDRVPISITGSSGIIHE